MTVPVSPDRLSIIQHLVSSGAYQTEEAVVNAAVDLLLAERREASLRAKIQIGLDDLAAGRVTVLNDDEEVDRFFDQVVNEVDARLDAKRQDAP